MISQIVLNGVQIENVKEYVYLGQLEQIGKEKKEAEIERRRQRLMQFELHLLFTLLGLLFT